MTIGLRCVHGAASNRRQEPVAVAAAVASGKPIKAMRAINLLRNPERTRKS